MATPTSTREAWLLAAVDAMRPLYAAVDVQLPEVRVSVGWPGGRGRRNLAIGECWPTGLAADGTAQLFISPVLDDAEEVLGTLAHELIHAWDDCKSGHKGAFAKVAKGIGLTGKMTATVPGPELAVKLKEIAAKLGAYPHAKLSDEVSGRKKQSTRMIKVVCPDSGYTLRTTRKWLDEVGVPYCPCCKKEMEID